MDRLTLRRKHRLSPGDALAAATVGPRTRPLRAALSALGIAIGIAALVTLIAIPASQTAQTEADLDAMGANLLVVRPGQDQRDQSPIPLPLTAPAMLGRIGPVNSTVTICGLEGAGVYRTDLIPIGQSGGIGAATVDGDLLGTLKVALASGRWFDTGSSQLPTAVLGASAAQQLGVNVGARIWASGQWWAVIGILESAGLAADLDNNAFLATGPVAKLYPNAAISAIYMASTPGQASAVRNVAAATANPANPRGVAVSQLSDYALTQQIVSAVFTQLSLALAGVALLVGGIGIANTMVVAVMERRGEIGLRRAIGARTSQIVNQFVLEAATIGLVGGGGGLALGAYAVFLYTAANTCLYVLPAWLLAAGPGLSITIGALAGLYPSLKAARQPPTQALRAV